MRKIKIAIIGAGPSGFGAAEVFRSEKYKSLFDITMYERNSYVGGKCCTVLADGTVANGEPDGYEMGATLLAKHTPSYKDLWQIIERYGIKTSVFPEASRSKSRYLKHQKQVPVKRLSWPALLHRPHRFFRTVKGYDEYALDCLKYSRSLHAGYTGRPKALGKRLANVYTSDVYVRLAGIMQGFGYADLENKHLTPALLYYHQYLEPGAIEYPIYKVDNGTQSIWSQVAASYPRGMVRLNQQVLDVRRTPLDVEITTPEGAETYDYLVVATPLKPALKFLDLKTAEKKFMRKMKHNYYVSVLCRASGLSAISTFNYQACYDKTRVGQVLCGYKRYPDSDYITAYLLLKKGQKHDDESIINRIARSLQEDLGASLTHPESAKVFHWPDYFGHLSPKDIQSGWYDNFEMNFQGKNRTLFVSSGLHMETVGASVQYSTREANKYARIWSDVQF